MSDVIVSCDVCGGAGWLTEAEFFRHGDNELPQNRWCWKCGGTGQTFSEEHWKLLKFLEALGIADEGVDYLGTYLHKTYAIYTKSNNSPPVRR